jgi:hypothetical protein
LGSANGGIAKYSVNVRRQGPDAVSGDRSVDSPNQTRQEKRKGLQLALEPLNGQGIAGYVPEPELWG